MPPARPATKPCSAAPPRSRCSRAPANRHCNRPAPGSRPTPNRARPTQILLALNRIAETVTPLRTELALAPTAGERNIALALVPRQYARASDKRLAASVVERALADLLTRPEHIVPAWSVVGRVRLAAGDASGALDAVRRAQAQDAAAEGPALLALEILGNGHAQADELVQRYIAQRPLPEVRLAYARILIDNNRPGDAHGQLKAVTERRPELAEAWLLLGLLQKDRGELGEAQASLQRYIDLSNAAPRGDRAERNRGLARAYLTLSQIAQQRGDLNAASAWLDKIEDPQDLLMAQTRRADLLAKQGRMPEARQLLRGLPGRTPDEVRTRLLAEVQLLRQYKQHQAAYELLVGAVKAQPQDTDLLYELAMSAEKLRRFDELEQLLRKVIVLKPDFPHAYNALGYSLADRGQRLDEARALILKALEFTPGDPMITDSLGWVEFRLGNNAEALRLLEQAFRGRPDPEIAAHLGEVLWVTGQRDRAQAIWREGFLLDRENEGLLDTMRRFKVTP